MDALKNFVEKDMIEQMVILESLKDSREKEAIGELFELLAQKKCDQATHEMIYHTLYDLMENDAAAIINGIQHHSYRVQLLSIRRCRKSQLVSVIPELIDALRQSSNTEITGEIIMTLGSYKDPKIIDILCPYLFYNDPGIVSCTMEALVGMENEEVREILIDLIKGDEYLEDPDQECSLTTILSVEHLGKIKDKRSIDFLAAHQNHPDPLFHKAVMKELENA